MSQEQLAREITRRSVADSWREARGEWSLETVYFATEPDQCLCGQFPIIELCALRNCRNGVEATVGNVCVKKFLGLPSDRIFNGLKRIQSTPEAALNEEAIEYAYSRRWISGWERSFYIDTRRKRNLSERQAAKRLEINEKIIEHVARDARPGRAIR